MTCPSTENLEGFLNGSIPPDAIDAMRTHVLGCARCQSALDQMTESDGLRAWRAAAGRMAEESQEESALLQLLADATTGPALDPTAPGSDPAAVPARESALLDPPSRPGDLGTLGGYHVEVELGRGGMGIVYRGFDPSLDRTVALKRLRPERVDEESRRRLVREARAAARFRHDHLVTVHAIVDPPSGVPYLVMEYLAGPSLAHLIHSESTITPRQAATWIAQIADGLAAAHEAGLVHRDVKPANILLDPDSGRVKLTDFGLARAWADQGGLTHEGTVAGTPVYMSPEQAKGDCELDARSDVYNLGATLYELLTRELPFRGSPHMVLRQILEDEPRPPRRLNDAVPRDLEVICLKAMAKEPARRYPSAAEFAADLRRWLGDEPIRARPTGTLEQLWRWSRRKPYVAALSATVLGLLLLIAVGSSLAAVRIARERRRADQNATAARTAQLRAEASARTAAEHFNLTLDALNTLIGVAQEQLRQYPGTIEARQRLVQAAVKGLRKIAGNARENPVVDRSFVLAHDQLGGLFYMLGNSGEARAQFEQARVLAETILKGRPNDDLVRAKLADAHEKLGNISLYSAQFPAAEAEYREALRVREALAERRPDDAELRFDLARGYRKIGDLRLQSGAPASARPLYERSLAILQDVKGTSAELDQNGFYGYEALGNAELALMHEPAAQAYFQKALAHAQAWSNAESADFDARRTVALAFLQLAEATLQRGEPSEAADLAQNAVDRFVGMVAADRDNTVLQLETVEADLLLGDARFCLRTRDRARAAYRAGLTIIESLARREFASVKFFRTAVRAYESLARLDEEEERYAEAADCLEHALAFFRKPKGAEAVGWNPPDEWRQMIETALATFQAAARGTIATEPGPKADPLRAMDLLRFHALRLARRGEYREAAAKAARLRRWIGVSAPVLIDVARSYALCASAARRGADGRSASSLALSHRLEESAVEALRASAEREPRSAQYLQCTPDLELLRDVPAFRRLIEERDLGSPKVDEKPAGGAGVAR